MTNLARLRLTLLLPALLLISSAYAEEIIKYGDFQQGFMLIVRDYAKKYKEAENDLQKSALVNERIKAFEKLNGSPRQIKGWYGVLEKMGTTGDGQAYISIRLTPNILAVSTWNNSFSDGRDKTLIPQTSPMYKKLSAMKVGNFVKFSGRLKHPTNFLEEGKMTTPDFLFIFSDIEKIGDRATP